MKILIINGPNINMIGIREPEIYGQQDYRALQEYCHNACRELGQDLSGGLECEIMQSNHEGDLVDRIQQAYFDGTDGIVINPGAYTHTSIAILDALKAVRIPAVEVHLTDISEREGFRQISYAGMACVKTYKGLGFEGYKKAVEYLKGYLSTAE
ncbi:MAG: 3-dehydroquinate dehydratase [Lachnospiraceae bacterium]|nr:3-dehydroquinate dehydratase [Lachnospiraceae bacterium]